MNASVNHNIDLNNPKSVFKKVLKDAIKNIIFLGILAIVIAFIINVLGWRILGLILGILYSLILGFGIIKFVIMDLPLQVFGIIVAIIEKNQGKSDLFKTQMFLLFGVIILLIENSASSIYLLYLYNAYYRIDLLGIF